MFQLKVIQFQGNYLNLNIKLIIKKLKSIISGN